MEHVIVNEKHDAAGRQRDPLAKAFQILNALVDNPDRVLGVRELAGQIGAAPSTTHRVLAMLTDAGMLAHDEGRYSVGYELQRLAWRVNARFPAPAIAEPVLRELTETTGETSALGMFDPIRNQLTFVAQAETSHRLRYMADLFQSIPIHAGASGLSILAFLSSQLRAQILHNPDGLSALTPDTLTDPAELEVALAEIRQRGYAISHGQRAVGAVGIGAPIWNHDGEVLGNIMVTVPEQRFDPSLEPALSQAVLRAAAEMTNLLGGRAPLRTAD